MTCTQCGGALGPPEAGDVAFGPNTTLVGVPVQRCPACGDEEHAIPEMEGLLSLLAAIPERPLRVAHTAQGWQVVP